MDTDVKITLGASGPDGYRPVTFWHAGAMHSDRLGPEGSGDLPVCLLQAIDRLGLDDSVLPGLAAQVKELMRQRDPASAAGRFALVTSEALAAGGPAPAALIEMALFAGLPAVLGGPPKTAKTLLAIDAAISLATGRAWLGRFAVPAPCSVIYFAGGGRAATLEYAARVAASKGVALPDLSRLKWCFCLPRFTDENDLAALARVLTESRATVAFFDGLTLCLSGPRPASGFQVAGAIAAVIRICDERGVTPVFIHRSRRGEGATGPAGLADLGQPALAEMAGQWWLLSRREAYDPREPDVQRLWLTLGGRFGRSAVTGLDIDEGPAPDATGRRWQPSTLAADEAAEQVADRSDGQRSAASGKTLERDLPRLLAATRQFPDGETASILRHATGLNPLRFGAALSTALQRGELERCGVSKGVRNSPYGGYRIPRPPEPLPPAIAEMLESLQQLDRNVTEGVPYSPMLAEPLESLQQLDRNATEGVPYSPMLAEPLESLQQLDGGMGISDDGAVRRKPGEKGDSPHLPERPGGCVAQEVPVPFFPPQSPETCDTS